MLYLNEDAVNSQIKICIAEREDPKGAKCPACCKVKSQKNLCSLGKARISPPCE